VVLGTGGAARAAVAALAGAGHRVQVVGRREEAAADLAQHLGGTPAPWEAIGELDFDVLVNATPRGADGQDPVIEVDLDWRGKAVLDMLLHPRQTPLLRAVRAGGGHAVPGERMWVHQGAAQWQLLTGHEVTAEQLTALLPRESR
jgi:shikimate dehydrogenase